MAFHEDLHQLRMQSFGLHRLCLRAAGGGILASGRPSNEEFAQMADHAYRSAMRRLGRGHNASGGLRVRAGGSRRLRVAR